MNGLAIAAAPLGAAGLGTLANGFSGARPETIRSDAAPSISAETARERATAAATLIIGRE